jgi:hypothetical protein
VPADGAARLVSPLANRLLILFLERGEACASGRRDDVEAGSLSDQIELSFSDTKRRHCYAELM